MQRLLSSLSLILGLSLANIPTVEAQQEVCQDPGPIRASEASREIELSQFGVKVKIPENFRAMARNDGSVWILDPGTYNIISCFARGGRGPGRGLFAYTFRVESDPQQLRGDDAGTYTLPDGSIATLLFEDMGNISDALAWFRVPEVEGVVVVSATCDCSITVEDIKSQLEGVTLD